MDQRLLWGALATEILTVVDAVEYDDFVWYKNGFPLNSSPCPSCSTLTVTDMGTYSIVVNGVCGVEKAEVEIACDCEYELTPIVNHTFTVSETLGSTAHAGPAWASPNDIDYVLGGTITVKEDVTLTISTANV